MATHWLKGPEVAAAAERLAPGSVASSDEVACYLRPGSLVGALKALRDDPEMNLIHLTNLCGMDYWDRFQVVYHLQSFDRNHFATIKVDIPDREDPRVDSVVGLWHGAWMQECEAYDMFGIRFEGHPNLYRILLWEGFPGWPLRKDFVSMPGGLQPGLNEFAGVAHRPEPPIHEVP